MRFRSTVIVSFFFVTLTAGLCVAEPTTQQWAKVMNLSGRQRMLTQKMSKEALFVTLDIQAERQRADLAKTTSLFEITLAGLRDGDASTGLPATENPRIVKQLDKIAGIYQELRPILESVAAGGTLSDDQRVVLAEKNLPLLKEMNKAVKMYERYAKKAIGGDEKAAIVINLAGKQRMLTQKMTKECLLVTARVDGEKNRLNLRETVSLFDRTLNGLIIGDEILDLPVCSNDKIKRQLEHVQSLWSESKIVFEKVIANEPLTGDELGTLVDQNVQLLKEMNKAVGMFEADVK